jgi:hypothetical protein
MKVIITRPWQLLDMAAPYSIRTNTEELATIKPREEIEIDIPSDAVGIYAKLAHFSSNGIGMENMTENMRLEVKNSCAGWQLLIPLFPLYYLIIARHRYLNIKIKVDPAKTTHLE